MPDYLSVEQAVEQLTASELAGAEPAPAAVARAPDPVQEPAAAEPAAAEPTTQSEDVTTSKDVEAPAEPASQDAPAEPIEPAKPAIDAPHFWSAEDKARFAEASPELQSVIAAKEKDRQAAVTQSQQAAADARRAAETEQAKIADLANRLGEVIPKAEAQFKSRWEGVTQADWVKLASENPDEYVRAKAMFDAESSELQRLQGAKEETDRVAAQRQAEDQRAYAVREGETLRKYAPELADPVNGKPLAEKLVTYLRTEMEVEDKDLPGLPAKVLAVALKAMKFDEAQKAARTPKQVAAKPASAPAVPARGAPAAPPKTAAANAMNRLAKTGRPEDAVDALLAMNS